MDFSYTPISCAAPNLEKQPFVPNQEVENSPPSQAYFNYFSNFNTNPLVSNTFGNRCWRVLTLFADWSFQLLTKVMRCFQFNQHLQQQEPTEESLEIVIMKSPIQLKEDDDKEIFNQLVNYQYFFDKTLSDKQSFNKFMFNNYNFESYLKLKSHDVNSMLKQYDQQEDMEFAASKAVYSAIVDLYVQRFLQKHPELDQEDYLSSLRMTALRIAIKCSLDEAICYEDLKGFIFPYMEIQEYYKMEIEFLKGIDWDTSTRELFIDEEDTIFAEE